MSKIKKFFEEWWPPFVIILAVIILIFSVCKLGHFIELKELHSYDYVSIDGVIYNTEDIDDISFYTKSGRIFYIKGTTESICTTHYYLFQQGRS